MSDSLDNPQSNSIIPKTNKSNLLKKLSQHKLKTLAGGTFILLLPALVIAAVLGPKIIDTTKGTNTNTFAQSGDPAIVGQWSEVTELPVKATHTSLLPNGKVMTWPSSEGDNAYFWDPETGATEAAPKAGYNIFCAGHSLTADGKLFVPGGHVVTPIGLQHASFYDPATNSWTRVANMNDKRWYPTVTTLTNGDLLTTSGTIEKDVYNRIPQVYNIRTNKWRTLSTAKLLQPLYPFMYQLSSGKVFMAGNTANTRILDTNGTGKWGPIIKTRHGVSRGAGSSVMFANNKILIVGGGTNSAEIISLGATTPKWMYTGSMSIKRRHANTTLLPTGEVLVTGGTSGVKDEPENAVLTPEIWNSTTGNWRKVAPQTVYRGYHSTALLLPDGRVFSGGGERVGGTSMEIYSPAYLFKGPRPTIASAPNQVNYGQKFKVVTPDASDIKTVRWIRLGSVTHSFNQSQRINALSFVKRSGEIEVTATNNAGATPPGHYMLFILNNNDVPSVAKIIKVGDINQTLPPPLPTLTPIPQTPAGDALRRDVNHEQHEVILDEFSEDPNI